MVNVNISAEIAAIKENLMVIKGKFNPLLDSGQYLDDVESLVKAIPKMLDNVEAMATELQNAFEILAETPRKDY